MSLLKYIITEQYDDEAKANMFDAQIAKVQRGRPEQEMLRVQKIMGGGVLSVVVEHIGDLTHRMTEKVMFDTAGYEYVKEKVEKGIRYLDSGYGFEREYKENIKANASFRDTEPFRLRQDIENALKKYADAHEKIPVYNEMQELARDSAIYIGRLQFENALKNLKELKKHIDKGVDHWVEVAHKIDKI